MSDYRGDWITFATQMCRAMGLKSMAEMDDGTRAVIAEKYELAEKKEKT